MRGIFITGTGTDVGKTYTSAFLLDLLTRVDKKSLYYKPVQCGPAFFEGKEYPGGDAQIIREAMKHFDTATTFELRTPSSPHYAFAQEGKAFAARPVQDFLVRTRRDYEFVVMEGAGGIRVPLNDHQEMSDLAKMSCFPVLVVTRPGLGTLNHTLLTLEHLKNRLIPIAGFVFSSVDGEIDLNDPLIEDNIRTLQKRTSTSFLGVIPPYDHGWAPEVFADHPLREYLRRVFGVKKL